jgi:hypothetical protein
MAATKPTFTVIDMAMALLFQASRGPLTGSGNRTLYSGVKLGRLGGSRTIISAERDRLTGLHRPIAIRGGQPEDVIVVAFDIRQGSADVRFGEESADSSEATADATALDSFAAAAANQEPRKPLITGNDLTGDDKEWQPISNAPVGQELEVRLEDPFGRHVLLFPCKLVPGQGWINSRLETPLPADPVDWRYWDELSIRF